MPLDISPAAQFIGGVILFIILGLSGNKLNNVRKKIQNKSRSTDDTIANLNEGIRVLKVDIAGIKKERDETNERYGALQVRVTELENEIKVLKATNKQLEDKALAIATERDNEIRANAKTATELAAERQITAQQYRRMSELEHEVDNLKREIAVNKTVDTIVTGLAEKLSGYRMQKITEKLPSPESLA